MFLSNGPDLGMVWVSSYFYHLNTGQKFECSHKIRTKIAQKGIHPTTVSDILMVSHLNTRHQKVWISNVSVFWILGIDIATRLIVYLFEFCIWKAKPKLPLDYLTVFKKIKAKFDSFLKKIYREVSHVTKLKINRLFQKWKQVVKHPKASKYLCTIIIVCCITYCLLP